MTDKSYLYPICHSRSSLTVQEERLTRSTSQGKRQIKTVLTNVVVEHVKSRMSNAKTPWFITSLNMLMCKCYDGNFTDFIHESLSYLQNSPDNEKQINRSQSHRVYLSEENLIERHSIEIENKRVKVCLLK